MSSYPCYCFRNGIRLYHTTNIATLKSDNGSTTIVIEDYYSNKPETKISLRDLEINKTKTGGYMKKSRL